MPNGKNGLPSTSVRRCASMRTFSAASSAGATREKTMSRATRARPSAPRSVKRTSFSPGAKSATSNVAAQTRPVTGAERVRSGA